MLQPILLHKLVPHSSYTEKVLGVARVFFEIATEGEYEIINGAGAGSDIVAPCGLQYVLPRYNLVLTVNEQL